MPQRRGPRLKRKQMNGPKRKKGSGASVSNEGQRKRARENAKCAACPKNNAGTNYIPDGLRPAGGTQENALLCQRCRDRQAKTLLNDASVWEKPGERVSVLRTSHDDNGRLAVWSESGKVVEIVDEHHVRVSVNGQALVKPADCLALVGVHNDGGGEAEEELREEAQQGKEEDEGEEEDGGGRGTFAQRYKHVNPASAARFQKITEAYQKKGGLKKLVVWSLGSGVGTVVPALVRATGIKPENITLVSFETDCVAAGVIRSVWGPAPGRGGVEIVDGHEQDVTKVGEPLLNKLVKEYGRPHAVIISMPCQGECQANANRQGFLDPRTMTTLDARRIWRFARKENDYCVYCLEQVMVDPKAQPQHNALFPERPVTAFGQDTNASLRKRGLTTDIVPEPSAGGRRLPEVGDYLEDGLSMEGTTQYKGRQVMKCLMKTRHTGTVKHTPKGNEAKLADREPTAAETEGIQGYWPACPAEERYITKGEYTKYTLRQEEETKEMQLLQLRDHERKQLLGNAWNVDMMVEVFRPLRHWVANSALEEPREKEGAVAGAWRSATRLFSRST